MAIRGTTPDYIIELDGVDLTGQTVYVTIRQGVRAITKQGDALSIATDASGSTIAFRLAQRDTLYLVEGAASIQVKIIDETGYVQATGIGSINIAKALLEKVITYADD